jgi:hypothetical protein
VRLVAVGVAVLVAALVGDVAAAVVLAGGTVTTFWGAAKVTARLVRLADLLGDLPERLGGIERRLDRGHEHFELIEDRLDALEAPAREAANASSGIARELEVDLRQAPG